MSVLVIAQHSDGVLKDVTLNTVTAAAQIGEQVHLLVAGHGIETLGEAAARVRGVDKVIVIDDVVHANGLAENLAAQLVTIAHDYSHIFFAATSQGKNVAPRLAALLDVAQISDITRVVDPSTFERPIYAGNVIARIRSNDTVKVITVRSTAFAASLIGDDRVDIAWLPGIADTAKVTFLSDSTVQSDRPDLIGARIVVSGGRGMGSNEKFQQVLAPLAKKLGAALGASRAAVDAGFAANDLQVGQTGKIVAPDLYVAVGISGAIQHLAGMKDSKVIVAINQDPDAPIFSIADYGLVGDLFDTVPALVEAL
jgi:electron transfer flavoprotein alpha subunit